MERFLGGGGDSLLGERVTYEGGEEKRKIKDIPCFTRFYSNSNVHV